MKVTVEEHPELEETEVVVRCRRLDPQISRLLELLRLSDARLVGEKEGQTCILEEDRVLCGFMSWRSSWLPGSFSG